MCVFLDPIMNTREVNWYNESSAGTLEGRFRSCLYGSPFVFACLEWCCTTHCSPADTSRHAPQECTDSAGETFTLLYSSTARHNKLNKYLYVGFKFSEEGDGFVRGLGSVRLACAVCLLFFLNSSFERTVCLEHAPRITKDASQYDYPQFTW